ncbi:TPA: hypothetical protein N0F65_001764 [Lagenidium giganteum]|uniref:Gamma-glutamyltranspeptidase n=1 Tax=Lagenidium giganteum TaxID=4803 RepID=A0AAV2Z1C8_9STRA|nr:TPA: hypothetical protein N0F65_001764 [Lagenidium giganteum]
MSSDLERLQACLRANAPGYVSVDSRSPVYGKHGMVACSQPLASEIGLRILRAGGNAVDAAIATAAALGVTEPCSTGIGGDCFLLYYEAATKKVHGLNGSGRSAAALTLEAGRAAAGPDAVRLPADHGHAVTVPGAVAGWVDALDAWGTMNRREVLEPAITLAREGFPVGPITAALWERRRPQLERSVNKHELMIDGRTPKVSEIFTNANLASCLEEITEHGKDAFYKDGRIARAIIDMVKSKGGLMTLEDLSAHESTFVDPIFSTFFGLDVYEIPPNGQGITALLALNLLQELLPTLCEEVSAQPATYWHVLIEAVRLAFADSRWYVCDPAHQNIPVAELLSAAYAKARAQLVQTSQACVDPKHGSPALSCDTVSFQVVDGQGNAVSMVNSNYEGFGSGFVPTGCGFTLQNRGCNFVLDDATHPNVLAPRKRSYHTIIPAITTFHDTSELHSSFTVMGGFMQPQGHVQLLCNLLLRGLNPQDALNEPRFCIDVLSPSTGKSVVFVEETMPNEIVEKLRAMGHEIRVCRGVASREVFGRGQMILRDPKTGVLCAGSDGRSDGCAMGW